MRTATLHLDSARAAEWTAILGTNEIPIQSPVPVECMTPGCDTPQLGYIIDHAELSVQQRERLIAAIAEKHGMDVFDAWAKLLISGIAIRAGNGGTAVSFAPELLPAVLDRLKQGARANWRRRVAA